MSAIGRRIIEHQIDTIERYHERNVVHAIVGYKKELIMDQSRNLIYIYNPRYSMDNTAVSLTRCFSKIDDDVIWINGDFTFKATIAKEAIAAAVRSRVAVTVTAVGGGGRRGTQISPDDQGRICELSKTVQGGLDESVRLNFVTSSAAHLTPLCAVHRQDLANTHDEPV